MTARSLFTLQAANIASRLVNLTDGVILTVNAKNVRAAPAVARALAETAAVPVFMLSRLHPALELGRVEVVHKVLYRLGLGTDRNTSWGHVKPIRVGKLVDAFNDHPDTLLESRGTADVRAWRRFYGTLSEFTHPNMGALTTGSKFDDDGGLVFNLKHGLQPSNTR